MDESMDDRFSVPTLEELGILTIDIFFLTIRFTFDRSFAGFDTDGLMPAVWHGGETEALTRLERHLERKAWVASFGRPKMTPQSLLASQTGLSPYLRFGCLSVRLFHQQLTNLYKKVSMILSIF
jgi:cryptochrome